MDADDAITALAAGEVVLLPTDTVYGIAAVPTITGATAALFALKDRSAGQPLAVLVSSREQALELCAPPTPAVLRLMDAFWPGPFTLVLPRSRDASRLELGGDPTTVGVRWPDHALVQAVARAVGPIATTSANRSGEPTPTTAEAAADALVARPAVVVDGGKLAGMASTVVDVTGAEPVVLRVGTISEAEVRRAWAG